ncbi:germination protein, Ger(x)C family [Paenibacillus curdlanolyticus YK9]|uniref:Germination protein, Ger(X)C family n=1 Tax=Paenibacillus curdlanolyticus YK9 TaxID=717606 RepID=E0IGI0_9BACL|nr:Ger(x)C family spore germination protein [Paenibacillus curdlanolyticus]EFM08420.1 germination protein, Ger(x)C family [Paenibacillus curdlanolyticus YK9]
METAAPRRLTILTAGMLSLLCLTGCWDRVEIDQRGFIVAVAIDSPKKDTQSGDGTDHQTKEQVEEPTGEQSGQLSKKPRYSVTYQIVTPSGMRGTQNGDQTGGKAYYHMVVQGRSMATMVAKLAQRTSRPPFFEHLKVIILSEEVARQGDQFADAIDFYLRESEMRRSTRIMVTRGKAAQILNTHPPEDRLPATYLELISSNTKESSRILPESRIGDVHEFLLKRESFVIQNVSDGNRAFSTVSDAAVFSGQSKRLIGFLDGEETAGLNFLRGDIKGGQIDFQNGNEQGVFAIERMKRHLRASFGSNGLPSFKISIQVEGTLNETSYSQDTLAASTLHSMQEATAKEIKRLTEKTISKLQQQYHCDVIGLGSYLHRKHYRKWQKLASKWEQGEQLFASSPIQVEMKVFIRRSGNIDRTEGSE